MLVSLPPGQPKVGSTPRGEGYQRKTIRKRGPHVKAYPAVAAGWLSLYGVVWAADDAFVGEWKLNPSKSKLRDEMRVESVGGNKYPLDSDGSIETIEAETDQPDNLGVRLPVRVLGSGRTIIMATWTLSQDGKPT